MYHKDSIKQSPGNSKGVSSGWGDDKGLIKEAFPMESAGRDTNSRGKRKGKTYRLV